jgi:hypothetical protein
VGETRRKLGRDFRRAGRGQSGRSVSRSRRRTDIGPARDGSAGFLSPHAPAVGPAKAPLGVGM